MSIRSMSLGAAAWIAAGMVGLFTPETAEAGVKVAVVAPRVVAAIPSPLVAVRVGVPAPAPAIWVDGYWTTDGYGRPFWVQGYWEVSRPHPVAVVAPARKVTVVRPVKVIHRH